jgi:hypothetical protein
LRPSISFATSSSSGYIFISTIKSRQCACVVVCVCCVWWCVCVVCGGVCGEPR